MKKLLAVALFAGAAANANADLLAYWNFNDSTANSNTQQVGVLNTLAPAAGSGSLTLGPGLTLNTNANGTADGNVGTFAGTTLNALFGDPVGGAMTIVAATGGSGNITANGAHFTFAVNMSGYQNLVVSFATRGTGTGFDNNQLSYSTDGANFTNFGAAWSGRPTTFFLMTHDLTSVTALNNEPTVYVRITVDGATGAAGNNRFDNVQFNATLIPAPGAFALLGLGGLVAARRRRD